MSEYLTNEKRIKDLLEFSTEMMNGKNGADLIKKYKNAIEHVIPSDLLKFEDMQFQKKVPINTIKSNADKIINVFFKTLEKYKWKRPVENTFLFYLMEENKALTEKLNTIKTLFKKDDLINIQNELLLSFKELTDIEYHYVKEENILFPCLENKLERYHALNVMWSLHDDARKKLKLIISILESDTFDKRELQIEIGQIFFLLFGIIQKENFILFPVASEIINDENFINLHLQSFEYGFAFIDTPKKPDAKPITNTNNSFNDFNDYILKTETGTLNAEQILLALNTLPLDITIIDENNKVRFFSKPKERFFPRSPAIIGRDVKNCHPPESVHVVEKIINAFKNGEKDNAKFWLTIKNKFILIQYFALRNDKNEYKGIMEVSQDVTEIRSLEGKQTLLDWKE
jgi:DUF438 domain-containing protein